MEGDAQSWRSRRPQGRKRRQKRPNSNEQAKIGRIPVPSQNGCSALRFDVEIPNYYNDTRDYIAQTSENGSGMFDQDNNVLGVVNETNPSAGDRDNGAVIDSTKAASHPESKALLPQSEVQEKIDKQDEANDKKIQADKKNMHDKFISALENHGSSTWAWDAMASELKWMVEDVKVYAYSYFKALTKERKIGNKNASVREADESRKRKNFPEANGTDQSSSWSFDELLLLDSLMIKYCKDLDNFCCERAEKKGR
mmetsp:Transcript_26423/g.63409  ORF Transcript_26423/g.63409 Transcript_26423/m.63409 type:complete len:254 (-) Transcript_26423:304-1065(-)